MTSLKELIAQRAELETKIAEMRKSEVQTAIASIRSIMEEHNLTQKDVFGRANSPEKKEPTKVPAKYRDPASGKTWSGRGLAPKWLEGKNREDFLVTK